MRFVVHLLSAKFLELLLAITTTLIRVMFRGESITATNTGSHRLHYFFISGRSLSFGNTGQTVGGVFMPWHILLFASSTYAGSEGHICIMLVESSLSSAV